jgi:putative DNA-invertase from lambdoid prophage Rac
MKRAAPPDLLDLCVCGCDFGTHDGRKACGRCGPKVCKAFRPLPRAARAVAERWLDLPALSAGKSERRAAIYLRVSTEDQTNENQRPDLEQLARARGLTVVQVFEEKASAASSRAIFRSMLDDAHRGRFHVVLVWALDRLGRSMVGNLQAVLALDRMGVAVVSYREPWLDAAGPLRELLICIFSWVAQQERARLIERTTAGLERARREGKRLGRPPARFDLQRAQMLQTRGKPVREIARELGVPRSVIARALRPSKGEP